MDVIERLTEARRRAGIETRSRVYDWFQENPCHTKRDCAEALGLSVATVGVHAKAIREGWRPEGVQDGA